MKGGGKSGNPEGPPGKVEVESSELNQHCPHLPQVLDLEKRGGSGNPESPAGEVEVA